MAVNYTKTLSTDMMVSEITSLIAWRDDLLRRSFYPESQTSPYTPPQSALLDWCRAGGQEIDAQMVNRLEISFGDLQRHGAEIADKQGLTLPLDAYDSFALQFTSYLEQVRRVYQELAGTAGAIDPLTGLRTGAGLKAELKREQDRYDRKGTSFSIASISIDSVERLKRDNDAGSVSAVYAGVAGMIARAIRSFDDAYHLGDGEYLITLKHVEFMDACAVMDRLCKDIADTPIALSAGGRIETTVSIGIAEAQEREQPDGVLNHAKAARLAAAHAGGNRVQEYHERSAFDHFARDMNRER